MSLSENGPEDGIVFFQFCAVRSVDIGVLYIDVLKYVNVLMRVVSSAQTKQAQECFPYPYIFRTMFCIEHDPWTSTHACRPHETHTGTWPIVDRVVIRVTFVAHTNDCRLPISPFRGRGCSCDDVRDGDIVL